MRKLLPCALLSTLILTCSGCGIDPISTTVAGGATVVSYSVLGKSPVDYGLSEFKHKDCDIRNPKKYNGKYCVDMEETIEHPLAQEQVYCYRTIGEVYCTRTPKDPHGNGSTPVGQTTTTYKPDYQSPVNLIPPSQTTSSTKDKATPAASTSASAATDRLKKSYNKPSPVLPPPASDPTLHGS